MSNYTYFITKDDEPFAFTSAIWHWYEAVGWIHGLILRLEDKYPNAEWEVYSLRHRCRVCHMPMPVDVEGAPYLKELCPKCEYDRWATALVLGFPTDTVHFCARHGWSVYKEWGCERCIQAISDAECSFCRADPGYVPWQPVYHEWADYFVGLEDAIPGIYYPLAGLHEGEAGHALRR
jgi:hypothetical protein